MNTRILLAASCLLITCIAGCSRDDGLQHIGGPSKSFTLAWSEYPSWSVFGVAHEKGLIHKDAGKLGKIEEKWGIDIVLKQLSYDGCLEAYGTNSVDAVCITNMDVLAPSLGRNSVAIVPTSTSHGADACIVKSDMSLSDLTSKPTYGLMNSVSQYTFERALEKLGQDPSKFEFKQLDPGKAAEAMQTGQAGYDSIVVWNPFVMQTLRVGEGKFKRLFDSTEIPEEIIDMIVIGEDSLKQTGGESFAQAIAETFYYVNRMLASSTQGDATLEMLGASFAGLGLEDMKQIVQETKFYSTPESGAELFGREDFQNTIMPQVVDFCVQHSIVPNKPSLSFGADSAQLRFSTKYMDAVVEEAQQVADEAATQTGG